MILGSHVSFTKKDGLVGSLNEALKYGANCFMFYTGAPQNTVRFDIDNESVLEGIKKIVDNNININNIVVHAPYIVNIANNENEDKYKFSIDFLINECKRCEKLHINKLVLHPGNYLKLTKEEGIKNIINALNIILNKTNVTILLETMSGKGTEVGYILDDLKTIINGVNYKNIGICLDTCHLFDSGYDISNLDSFVKQLKDMHLYDKVKCIHINDSKNIKGSKKDRHENIGFGNIGFETLVNFVHSKYFEGIPKILETPWINSFAPYKEEIKMLKSKRFDISFKENVSKFV